MISEALNAYVATKSKEWSQDRSQTVGASEVGSCARKVWFTKNADDPSVRADPDADYQDGWGARTRGNLLEDHLFVPAVRARYGDKALYTGDMQRTFVSGYLSATPDGLLIDQPSDALAHLGVDDIESDCIDLDCKSVDPRVRVLPKEEHVFQIHVQVGLIREMTNHQPIYGVLAYLDASFPDQVKEFPIRFDPAVYATAKDRARSIMSARSASEIRPEGVIAGGKECEFCAYTAACGTARARMVPSGRAPVDHDTAAAAAEIAARVKQHEAEEKTAALAGNEAKQELRDFLSTHGTKFIPDVCSWSAVKGKKGWDNAGIREAAKAAGVDLGPYEREGNPSDRLTIAIK